MKIVAAVVVCLTKGDPIGLPPAATVFPGLPLAAKFGNNVSKNYNIFQEIFDYRTSRERTS